MLTPKQLDQYPDALVELYAQAEADILADMAKRISAYDYFIPAAQWQYQKLIEMGALHDTILTKLSQLTGKTKEHLQQLMSQAGAAAIKTDDAIYKKAGLDPLPINASPALQSVLAAGITNTGGLFDNLTRTTANTATRQFERALDRAWMQINTGAFSYQEAIRATIKELASKGIESIPYPSGHTDHMDVAVRRAVLTGVNQTALRMQDARADELGSDLVETTAHAGARPSHALWQGRIFSRSGTHPKYPDFVSSTGYGTGPGLGGWNCRHSYFPYFEGISDPTYSQAELADLNAKKYEYNGEKLTEYEASQKQRLIERNLRRWKREFVGMDAAGLDTGESAAKIAQWQRVQRDFLQQTGLKRQTDRESTANFSRSQASKASAQAKVVEFIRKDAILKAQSNLPKRIDLQDEILKETINVDFPSLHGVVPKGATLTNVYVMAGDDTSVPIRDLKRLHDLYGGLKSWQKKSGDVVGDNYKYVIHWYQNKHIAPKDEFKLKGVRKK